MIKMARSINQCVFMVSGKGKVGKIFSDIVAGSEKLAKQLLVGESLCPKG